MHFGLSEPSAATLRRANAVLPVAAVQTEYSLMERTPEISGILDACEELGVGFVPWGPVGMGWLTGTMGPSTVLDTATDVRAGFDRFSPANLSANAPIVQTVVRLAQEQESTPSQIALAWLLAQRDWIVPIPGTRNVDHLQENLGALDVELTATELTEIDDALSSVQVFGDRMNASERELLDETV